jgi:hypothetical protein
MDAIEKMADRVSLLLQACQMLFLSERGNTAPPTR